jgi:chemotaxis signal transduction protein
MSAADIPLVPSFVVFRAGERRIAFPRESVRELIASPSLFSFPHTTPGLGEVLLRRGRILPVLNLGPELGGEGAPQARFFLVVERNICDSRERCAIPIQGECELVTGIMIPADESDGAMMGHLDLNGEQIEVLDVEKAIAGCSAAQEGPSPVAEAQP